MEVGDSDGKYRFDLSSACANFVQTVKLAADHPLFGKSGVGFFIIIGIRTRFLKKTIILPEP